MDRVVRLCLVASVAFLVVACADSKEVNAAFSRTRVSWFVFDAVRPDGVQALAGFDQMLRATWVPRPQSVRATDLAVVPGGGAVAVSRLGLLLLDDSSGSLTTRRPTAQWPLSAYVTDRLFLWKGKVFLTLLQEPPAEAPPASLAWWAPGQDRLAFYPIPSQLKEPKRQAVAFSPPGTGSALDMVWKYPQGAGWSFEASSLALDTGIESPTALFTLTEAPLDAGYEAVKARLAERLGTGVPARAAKGGTEPLVFTETGWVAVGKPGEGKARLYHLPELGAAGRYTGALALSRGWVFTWETAFRGYVGSAGLVHVPFAVLAP